MTLISGASRFINQATLAAQQGGTYTPPNVLGESSATSLLDVGRGNSAGGVGLSGRARALNYQLLTNNVSTINGLFSLTGGGSATVESAQTQIKALRARLPQSSLDGSVVGTTVDEQAEGTAASDTGTVVDQEA